MFSGRPHCRRESHSELKSIEQIGKIHQKSYSLLKLKSLKLGFLIRSASYLKDGIKEEWVEANFFGSLQNWNRLCVKMTDKNRPRLDRLVKDDL